MKFKENKVFIVMAILFTSLFTGAIITNNPFLFIFAATTAIFSSVYVYQSKNAYDGHNSIKWILPILKLSAELIKIDGDVQEIEIRKVENYLKEEFTEKRAQESILKFREYLRKDYNLRGVCEKLNQTNEMGEKTQILHFLIKLAVSDKFLSNKEEQIILLIMKWMNIPKSRLNSILSLHNFIYENETKNKKTQTSKPTFRIDKAYNILNLPSSALLDEVKKAYRELAKIYHPDKVRDKQLKEKAKEQFQIITEAYEMIKKEKG